MLLPAALFGMFFLGALYLQRVLGYDALGIGLAFLPYTVVQGTLSVRYTDRLIARLGAKRLIAIGIVPFGAGWPCSREPGRTPRIRSTSCRRCCSWAPAEG